MAVNLSLATILASLQAQIAQHREQEAFHAEREAFHRERRAEHAAELAQLEASFESLRTSAENAARLAARLPLEPPPPPDDLPVGRKVSINHLVARVVEGKAPQETFGPLEIANEVNQRFAGRLGWTVDARQVSVTLRWMAASGRLVQARKGHGRRSSKYSRPEG
jgi:hypothetical protein